MNVKLVSCQLTACGQTGLLTSGSVLQTGKTSGISRT